MIIGCITDEISDDVDDAISFGREQGLDRFELRKIGEARFPWYPEAVFKRLLDLHRMEGVTYTAASPGIFKPSYTESLPSILHAVIRRAYMLEIPTIIVFSGDSARLSDSYLHDITAMRNLAELVENEGMRICIENSSKSSCGTSRDLLQLLEDIDDSSIRINWDPANAFMAGEQNYQQGYMNVRGRMGNFHTKDVSFHADGSFRCVPVGDGMLDYRVIFRQLACDGYEGPVTIETHCTPRKEAFMKSLSSVRGMLPG